MPPPRQPPDKGISGRYVILSIPLPAVIMSRGEIANDDAAPKQFRTAVRSPIYKFGFISPRDGGGFIGSDARAVHERVTVIGEPLRSVDLLGGLDDRRGWLSPE